MMAFLSWRPPRRLPALCLLLLLAARPAAADIRIVARETHNGQPASTTTLWFGDRKRAREEGTRSVVTRLDLEKIYVIDREAKTYETHPLELAAGNAGANAVATSETAVIGKWLCRRYRVEGPAVGGRRISLWLTKDIKLDAAEVGKTLAQFGSQAGAEWLQVYAQLDGVPVVQEVSEARRGISQSRRSEVISIERLDPPPDTYLPPRGYRRQR